MESATAHTPDVAVTVVVPTYQRRERVVALVQSLDAQATSRRVDVVVVVDGSTDGTGAALRTLRTRVPLTVIEQANAGRSSACNAGAARAGGDVLVFLDDDMVASPGLVDAHVACLADGELSVGDVPMHPDSPPSVLTPGLDAWAAGRRERLTAPGARLELGDFLTGNMAIRRTHWESLGGFDEAFTAGGTFGNEDIDLGVRAVERGLRLRFSPDAVAWQHYVVSPRAYLRQWFDAGAADVALVRKHPLRAPDVMRGNRAQKPSVRLVWRPLTRGGPVADAAAAVVRAFALRVIARLPPSPRTVTLFSEVRRMEYWRGVRAAGGFPRRGSLRVLCYHAVADLSAHRVHAPYGVPAPVLRAQLSALRRAGARFVAPAAVDDWLAGRAALPRRAVLVTFDDAYRDVHADGLPVLEALGVPGVVFAVAGLTGGTNAWDDHHRGARLELMDADELRDCAARGLEVGAHSRTHPQLPTVAGERVAGEVAGSADDLEALGLARPRFFAYPYGEHDGRATSAVAAGGYRAAFTVDPGVARPGADRWLLPRIELGPRDRGLRLLLKVAVPRAATLPARNRRLRAWRRRWAARRG